jgi:flagellar hook-basal body complex protein FliE
MTIVNNSLYSQMQNMSVEAIGKPQNISEVDNKSTNAFGDLLTNAMESVTDLHKDAGKKVKAFVIGESNITLAEIMIARSKAGIATDATIQVRNKAIEGYKEIMSMPV